MPRPRFGDVYHTLLSMSWMRLCLFVASTYVLVNVVFAALYLAQAGSIDNARPGSFLDHFYFSVQTMATIGYGKMTPVTDLANILVAIEALLGMLGIAMATGLIFAKFARTRPRVLFSRAVVVAPMDGKPALMFRLANERSTQIVEAQLSVTVLRDEVTKEGEFMRRLHEIPLLRAHSAMFALSWSAIHIIDEKSPFHGATAGSWSRCSAWRRSPARPCTRATPITGATSTGTTASSTSSRSTPTARAPWTSASSMRS